MTELETSDDVLIKTLLIDGGEIKADVKEAIHEASLTRSIEQAATIHLTVHDPRRELLNTGLVAKRSTTQIDGRGFELVAVEKADDMLDLTFEDVAIAAMRRQTTPEKIAAGTMSRVEFARQLLRKETPWIDLLVVNGAKRENAKVDLTKGDVDAAKKGKVIDDPESTWDCFRRIFDAIGWRVFVDNGKVVVGPDSAFLAQPSKATIKEGLAGIDRINWEYDTGKEKATAKVSIYAHRWEIGPGSPVTIEDEGPASGKWLVSEIDSDMYYARHEVSLVQPRPELPEPESQSTGDLLAGEGLDAVLARIAKAMDLGNGGLGDGTAPNTAGLNAPGGYIWPCGGAGSITGRFAENRGDHDHSGIDIACPAGTQIRASRGGVVTLAAVNGGYGNCVEIAHVDNDVMGPVVLRNESTLYGHMQQILTTRGAVVRQGQVIGLVGSTGHSTGPHCHFEVKKNGKPVDPMSVLFTGGDGGSFGGDKPRGGASGSW